MEVNDLSIFLFSPFVIFNVRIEVIVPSLSALLTDSARKVRSDLAPVFSPMLKDKLDDNLIFFLGPRSFCQSWIEYFLPSVQTLHVSSAFQFSSNLFPPFSSILLHQSPQIFILKVITPYLLFSPILFQLLL